MIGPALAGVLRAGRAGFNQRFQDAARAGGLDGEDFQTWLTGTLDPVAEALAATRRDGLAISLLALYEMGLALVARGWLGPKAREPAIDAGLRTLLTALPQCLAAQPTRFPGALVNALHRLAQGQPQRALVWAQDLSALAPWCDSAEQALSLGRVLAWRLGLASLRQRALADAQTLPGEPLRLILGLERPPTGEDLARWLHQPQAMPGESAAPLVPRLLGWAGGFAGFGGPFRRPPLVGLDAGRLVAGDGESRVALFGDGYGTEAVQIGGGPVPTPADPSPARVSGAGLLAWNGRRISMPELASARAWQWHQGLLAVALGTSHRVALLRCELQ